MTDSEMLQFQVMNRFFDRLMNLTDTELMTRKQMEIEKQGNLTRIRKEISRRNSEL